MNDTSVPILEIDSTEAVLARLTAEWDELTPEAQKAARYVLDNPQDVGVSTVREIAEAANVKPNTVVRMARQAGFEGYEDFAPPSAMQSVQVPLIWGIGRVGCKRLQNRAIWAGSMPIWSARHLKMFRTVLQT